MSNRNHVLFTLLTASVALSGCESKKQTSEAAETSAKSVAQTTASAETAAATTSDEAANKEDAKPGKMVAAGSIEVLPYNNKAPAGLTMTSPITHALGWKDSEGENALVFAQKSGANNHELFVRHARRANVGEGAWETVRDFKERVTRCSGDAIIEVAASAWKVTDLDADGVGEATFAYRAGCRTSSTAPIKHKVLLIEDGEKFALRGESEVYGKNVVVDAAGNKMGETVGGKFKADPAFEKAPEGFKAHAESVWRASVLEDGDGAVAGSNPSTAIEDGEYLDTQTVLADADTEEMAKVTDCFSLWTFEDGTIEFGLELNFDLDHSCSIHGEASAKNANTWVYKGSAETHDEGCTLELAFGKDYVDFTDGTGTCREVWCGARGSLDSARYPLKKKNRREDTKKCGR